MSFPAMQSADDRPVFRFAPSPNGPLHLGHAYSAIINFDMAKALGGRFLLRIEDIDRARCRSEFEEDILRDLDWLGLEWETPVRRQSEHFGDYQRALDKLSAKDLLYPCFASRQEIRAAASSHGGASDPDGAPLYPGLWRNAYPEDVAARQASGEPHALRLTLDRALASMGKRGAGAPWIDEIEADGAALPGRPAEPERWGDVVLARKDVPTSYHLSVVVDDALQGVTHVTRGQDLYWASDIQRVLQELLGLPAPLYHHHRLIRDPVGRKLSKSNRDTSLAALRAGGASPADVRRMIADNLNLERDLL